MDSQKLNYLTWNRKSHTKLVRRRASTWSDKAADRPKISGIIPLQGAHKPAPLRGSQTKASG